MVSAADALLFIQAANRGDAAEALRLADTGVNVNTHVDRTTALHYAAQYDNCEFIRGLVARKANINARDRDGQTPLHLAVLAQNEAAVKTLLELGARTDIQNNDMDTLLHLAACKQRTSILRLLVEHDSNINLEVRDKDLCTPLHIAALHGMAEAVELLLQKKPIRKRAIRKTLPRCIWRRKKVMTTLFGHC